MEPSELRIQESMQILMHGESNPMENGHDDLLDDLVLTMTELSGEYEREKQAEMMAKEALLAEDQEKEEKKEEGKEKLDRAKRATIIVEDDIPKEDFFESKDEEETKTGSIEGIEEVNRDSNTDEFHQMKAQRLSIFAQNFSTELDGEIKKEPLSTRASGFSASSEYTKKEGEGKEEEKKEEDKEEERKEVTAKVKQSRVTIASVDFPRNTPALSVITADFKPRDESGRRRTIDSTKRKSVAIELRMSGDLTLSRVSGYSSGIPSVSVKSQPNQMTESEIDLMEFFNLDTQDNFILPDVSDMEFEEEEIISVSDDGPPPLDRVPYYEKYDEVSDIIGFTRMKNNILHKKVTMYLKRRKVENFTKEGDFFLDHLNKYNQKLDAYEQLLEFDGAQRKTWTEELDILKKKRASKNAKMDSIFKGMQIREATVGIGLIFTKTGNAISDKLVERMLRRQKIQMEQVASMRLKCLKLQGMVQEKLNNIERMDQLEDNLRLTDYEQLKADNRNYADKYEERDEELTRLRAKCLNTIQILAHMREKTAALETDKEELQEDLEELESTADHYRETLVDLKHKRDKQRNLITKIKIESGLLIEPTLLKDMQESLDQIQEVREQLENYKEEYKEKTIQIRYLRKNIEKLADIIAKKKKARSKTSGTTLTTISLKSRFSSKLGLKNTSVIYSKRPTLLIPEIKHEAFDDLVTVKPNPRAQTRKRR